MTIHKKEVVAWTTDKMPHLTFSTYDSLPEEEYDLIINDGPSPFLENGFYLDLPNATITKLLIEEKIKVNSFVVWDGRQHMLTHLERYYGENFELYRPAQKGDDMNILKFLGYPVIYEDAKHKAMLEESNYFKGHEDMPAVNS
jgi:hypothetical protein